MEEFSRLLFSARKAAGLTQSQLAERVGCSKSYVSTLERNSPHTATGGDITPSVELVDAIAVALRVPVNPLRKACGYDSKTAGDTNVPIIVDLDRISRRLPESKRGLFWRQLEQLAELTASTMMESA